MNPGTATKVVAVFAVGGIGIMLWTGKDGADRYRKVWGVTLLSAVGAALADFAPSLVGWYFALIIVAYTLGNQAGLTNIVSGVRAQATGTTKKG